MQMQAVENELEVEADSAGRSIKDTAFHLKNKWCVLLTATGF